MYRAFVLVCLGLKDDNLTHFPVQDFLYSILQDTTGKKRVDMNESFSNDFMLELNEKEFEKMMGCIK